MHILDVTLGYLNQFLQNVEEFSLILLKFLNSSSFEPIQNPKLEYPFSIVVERLPRNWYYRRRRQRVP